MKSAQAILDDFQNLPKDVGAWPLAPRITSLLGIFILILVGGWYFLWNGQIDTLTQIRQDEQVLKEDFVKKKEQAVNRDLYTQQLNEIDRSFGALLKQLPNQSEVESLLLQVNQSGMGRGLQFELFKPDSEVLKDFYAELPIQVKLVGNYHDFGAFAEDIGKLSRIVTLNNISITSPNAQTRAANAPGQAGGGALVMEAVTKTFRYLDEEELAAKRKAEQETAKGRRK